MFNYFYQLSRQNIQVKPTYPFYNKTVSHLNNAKLPCKFKQKHQNIPFYDKDHLFHILHLRILTRIMGMYRQRTVTNYKNLSS